MPGKIRNARFHRVFCKMRHSKMLRAKLARNEILTSPKKFAIIQCKVFSIKRNRMSLIIKSFSVFDRGIVLSTPRVADSDFRESYANHNFILFLYHIRVR